MFFVQHSNKAANSEHLIYHLLKALSDMSSHAETFPSTTRCGPKCYPCSNQYSKWLTRFIMWIPWHGYTLCIASPSLKKITGHQWICSFDDFFAMSLNKLLNEELSCQWFQPPWSSYDITVMIPIRQDSLYRIWILILYMLHLPVINRMR